MEPTTAKFQLFSKAAGQMEGCSALIISGDRYQRCHGHPIVLVCETAHKGLHVPEASLLHAVRRRGGLQDRRECSVPSVYWEYILIQWCGSSWDIFTKAVASF